MHSIERYGVVALVFLVVTIVAVLSWERGEEPSPESAWNRPMAQARAATTAQTPTEPEHGVARDPFVTASTRPRPLRRELEGDLAQRSNPSVDAPGRPGGNNRSRRAQQDAELRQGNIQSAREPVSERRPTLVRDTSVDDAPSAGRRVQQGRPSATPSNPQPIQRAEPRIYVVRSGDTLSEIALRQTGTSKRWKEIVDLNPGLDPKKLKVGARLRMPAPGSVEIARAAGSEGTARPSAAAPTQAEPQASGPEYKVRSGDSLWKIASRTLGDGERWRELEKLNPKINPNKLLVGQVLRLPEGASPNPVIAQADPSPAVPSGRGSKKGKVR